MTPEQLKPLIEKYKKVYKKHYGVELSDYEATKQYKNLLGVFCVLTDTDTKELL